MAALIPALIKLLMSRRGGGGGGGGGYSRGGYGRGGGGGGGGSDKYSDPSMYYTNLDALKEGQLLPDWSKDTGKARAAAADRKAAAVKAFLGDMAPPEK
jgi:hypothetical protein